MNLLRKQFGLRWKGSRVSLSDIPEWLYDFALWISIAALGGFALMLIVENAAAAENEQHWMAVTAALLNGDPIESDDGQWAARCEKIEVRK